MANQDNIIIKYFCNNIYVVILKVILRTLSAKLRVPYLLSTYIHI